MALTTIYPKGEAIIDIPLTQSIAISNYGGGIASIYYLIEDSNRPDAYQLQQTLENSGVVLGAFANGKKVKIDAGGSTVIYDVGASPDTGIGNADTLNGLASDTADTASTIAARDSSGDIQANAFESTVTTGTAPLTVASTTVVTNLNADLLDGQTGSYYATDSAVVHKTGAETVAGKKTWSSSQSHANGSVVYVQQADTTEKSMYYMTSGDYIWLGSSSNPTRQTFSQLLTTPQVAPSAKTTDATLTTAELNPGIITVNNGAAGTTALTLPLATAMDSDFAYVGNDYGITFTVINISTVAAEDCTITTNTGWTLVGSMVVESNDADRAASSGVFRARKTGTGAWTLYRIA